MNKRTFQRISSFLIFKFLVAMLLFHSTLSAPVKATISYDAFLKNITDENCSFPNGIVLPFRESATTLQYFSEPLKICKAPDAITRSLEAIRLCNEIYDALRNITCHSDKNVQLPEIKIEFSDNVCKDISSLKLQHTLEENGLLQHLTDKFVCEMMCEDDFLPACKVLLWSFQLQKRIVGIPLVQSIQNTPGEENINAGNGAPSSVTKTLVKPDEGDPVVDKEQELLQSKQDISAIENPDSNNKVDEAQLNGDIDNNDDQTMKKSKDEQNIREENEIPEDKTMEVQKDNQLGEKQDQTLKLDEQNQLPQIQNEAVNAKEEAVEPKIKEPTAIIKNLPSSNENKIDVDEGPQKNSKLSDSQKPVFKVKVAVLIPEQTKDVSNKTGLTKDIDAQNNLRPEIQKESPVNVKHEDTKNTPNDPKPVISGQSDELSKLQGKVSHPSIPSKVSSNEANEPPVGTSEAKVSPVGTSEAKVPPVGANEAKVSIKPEVAPSKGNEVADKIIPTVGKEDVVSVATVADLEKMEEGNGIPEPADKDPDLYNDLEGDGEYSKLEYGEDGIYDSSKNKKPEESDGGKISKPAVAENESPKYDVFPQRNSFGRGPDDIQVIPSFPEQEDSHFFFYFLSLVLILMAGYLLFHNKQKIIALIVEGRHERRRRSHGVGYKKLETK